MNYFKNGDTYISTIGDLGFERITEEEYAKHVSVVEERMNAQEALLKLTRPRTIEEGMMELSRSVLTDKLSSTDDKTLAIACMAFFETWKRGAYSEGDVRTDPETGYPYECILAHDSTVNTDWTIKVRTLWKPYHSRKKEYALPWEVPTGAHDMYKSGEYMIWTDYEIYECISDTNFSPADYPAAWNKVS